MNAYIIKRNGNPMAVTTDETIVEALLEYTRGQHWLRSYNNPKYKKSFTLYQQQNSWSRQCIEITNFVPASTIQAPPSHNPKPATPRGTGQILPNQKQVHRLQPQTVPTALPALVEQFAKGVITELELNEKANLLGYNQITVDEAIKTYRDGHTGVS